MASIEVDDFLSHSESDGDGDEDSAAHARLVADLKGITNKKSSYRRRPLQSTVRTSGTGDAGVDDSSTKKIEKQVNSVGLGETAPHSKQERKRIDRKRDFEALAEDLNKWEGVIQQNRNSTNLSFPLESHHVTLKQKADTFNPRMKTKMEQEVYEMLSGSGLLKQKKESAEERAVREAMTLEEVMERNKESWRARTLQYKLGKKANIRNKTKSKKFHRILKKDRMKKEVAELEQLQYKLGKKANIRNKTKSKKFHRILKKDRMKKEVAELEQLQKTDPGKALDKLQRLEDIRIEERMSLKHKKSKWANNLQLRAKTDKAALSALQENSRLHKELVTKLQKKDESDDSGEEEDSDDSDGDEHDPEAVTENCCPAPGVADKTYLKMKTFWGEYNKQKAEEIKDHLEEIRKKRKQPKKGKDNQIIDEANAIIEQKLQSSATAKKNNKQKTSNATDGVKIRECEFTFSSMDKPDNPMDERRERLTTLEDMDNLTTDKVAKVSAAKLKGVAAVPQAKKKPGLPEVDATKIRVLECKTLESPGVRDFFNNDSDSDEDMEDDPHGDLFDDDDQALEEFNKDRDAAAEAAQPKDMSFVLPGWGEWYGPDLTVSNSKKKYFTHKAPKQPPSKFSDKSNVIYNEKADLHQNIRIRMVSQLPYPFTSVDDYEKSIRGPTGRTFVPELVHRKLIKPSLETMMGTVIKPMDKSQLLKDNSVKEIVKEKLEKKRKKEEAAGGANGEAQSQKKYYVRMGKEILKMPETKKRFNKMRKIK